MLQLLQNVTHFLSNQCRNAIFLKRFNKLILITVFGIVNYGTGKNVIVSTCLRHDIVEHYDKLSKSQQKGWRKLILALHPPNELVRK